MKSLEELKDISDKYFHECEKIIQSHPWAICIAMHEYARNLYPHDPYIKFPGDISHTDRLPVSTGYVNQ